MIPMMCMMCMIYMISEITLTFVVYLFLKRGRSERYVRIGDAQYFQLLAAGLQLLQVQNAMRVRHRADVGQVEQYEIRTECLQSINRISNDRPHKIVWVLHTYRQCGYDLWNTGQFVVGQIQMRQAILHQLNGQTECLYADGGLVVRGLDLRITYAWGGLTKCISIKPVFPLTLIELRSMRRNDWNCSAM